MAGFASSKNGKETAASSVSRTPAPHVRPLPPSAISGLWEPFDENNIRWPGDPYANDPYATSLRYRSQNAGEEVYDILQKSLDPATWLKKWDCHKDSRTSFGKVSTSPTLRPPTPSEVVNGFMAGNANGLAMFFGFWHDPDYVSPSETHYWRKETFLSNALRMGHMDVAHFLMELLMEGSTANLRKEWEHVHDVGIVGLELSKGQRNAFSQILATRNRDRRLGMHPGLRMNPDYIWGVRDDAKQQQKEQLLARLDGRMHVDTFRQMHSVTRDRLVRYVMNSTPGAKESVYRDANTLRTFLARWFRDPAEVERIITHKGLPQEVCHWSAPLEAREPAASRGSYATLRGRPQHPATASILEYTIDVALRPDKELQDRHNESQTGFRRPLGRQNALVALLTLLRITGMGQNENRNTAWIDYMDNRLHNSIHRKNRLVRQLVMEENSLPLGEKGWMDDLLSKQAPRSGKTLRYILTAPQERPCGPHKWWRLASG